VSQLDWREHWLRNTVSVLSVILVAVASVVGIYLFGLARSFDSKTQVIEHAFPDESVRPPPPAVSDAATAQNILLLGSDTRGAVGADIDSIRGQRSDMIMVVHVPANHKHLYAMSIMRDSWVDIPGRGKAKVNAALSWGGAPLAVRTVEDLISVRIDHVVIVDFAGFQKVTDALGGVVVNNTTAFTSRGSFFAVGVQRLDGADALKFVRARYPFADGDFQRVRNQQSFVKAVVETAFSKDTLLDPLRVISVVEAIAPFLKVDKGLNAAYISGLGIHMTSLRMADMTFFTAPTAGTGTSGDGQSIVNVDWSTMPALQEAFREDKLETYSPVDEHMAG
jgi:polyisoprenyl-teichoic acid--peptidoglycan teichoic acid transferase